MRSKPGHRALVASVALRGQSRWHIRCCSHPYVHSTDFNHYIRSDGFRPRACPMSMKRKLHALLAIGLLFRMSNQAGAVRASFLTDDAALQETLEILRSSGCAGDAIIS